MSKHTLGDPGMYAVEEADNGHDIASEGAWVSLQNIDHCSTQFKNISRRIRVQMEALQWKISTWIYDDLTCNHIPTVMLHENSIKKVKSFLRKEASMIFM